MTVFSAIYTIVFALLIGAIMLLMPALVAKTLPLGVSVPAERADEPVIAAAIRRYRALVVVAALTTVVVGLLLAIVAPVAAMIVSPLLILALTAAAYLTARARIVEAKREGEWYRGVRTRVSADVAPPRRLAPPIGWLLACVALLVVIAAVGVALYPSIPAVLPMHWNAAGQVDRTAAKSVWTVFQLPLIAALLAVGFYGLSWLIRWMPVRARASEAADGARRRADATLRYTTMALGVIALVIVVGFGAMSILTWTGATAGMTATSLAFVCVLVLAVIGVLAGYARAVRPPAGETKTARAGADAPDDDRYWKGGLIYVNRNDPATFVPKRFGVGWTINLASPGGIGIAVALAVILLGSIVLGVVAPHAR